MILSLALIPQEFLSIGTNLLFFVVSWYLIYPLHRTKVNVNCQTKESTHRIEKIAIMSPHYRKKEVDHEAANPIFFN